MRVRAIEDILRKKLKEVKRLPVHERYVEMHSAAAEHIGRTMELTSAQLDQVKRLARSAARVHSASTRLRSGEHITI